MKHGLDARNGKRLCARNDERREHACERNDYAAVTQTGTTEER